jgi:MFS family permease
MNKKLRFVFFASFLFWCHMALVTYINSSLLELYVSPSVTSTLFALGSALNIIWVLQLPKIVNRFGVAKVSSILMFATAILCGLVGFTANPFFLLPLFVVFFSMSTAILYTLDILVEKHSTDEVTGNIRGILLTINNFAMALLPFFVGILTEKYGFTATYSIAAVVLVISGCIIVATQKSLPRKTAETPNLREGFRSIVRNPALRRIITINFLLQFFFAWMVIYTPLYLANTLSFDWSTIGIILSIMLVPFVLFQFPAGRIADTWLGEKEMLITALIIAGVATICFAVLPNPTVVTVAITLFCTRIGASIVEVMCDSYFFKQIDETNVHSISFYRIMYPLAYIIGPITAALILSVSSYLVLFITLGGLMFVGAFYALRIVDTK